jgi:hypothetical protein
MPARRCCAVAHKPNPPLECRLCWVQVFLERMLVKNIEVGAATLPLDQVRLCDLTSHSPTA